MWLADQWRDEENARRYDSFAREYPMYRLTSQDLVERAHLAPDSRVLDLACGTGVTTESILPALGHDGSVIGVDASAAMLDLARARIHDARVTWLETTAETIAASVPTGLTHIICNSAIWQFDLAPVARAVSELLAPGGRFVCNIGTTRTSNGAEDDQARKPSLHELMRAFAVIDHDFVSRPSPMSRRLVTEQDIRQELTERGLVVEPADYAEYDFDAQQLYAWTSIPLFTEQFTGLTYHQRMDALNKAYAQLDPTHQQGPRWAIISAHVAGGDPDDARFRRSS